MFHGKNESRGSMKTYYPEAAQAASLSPSVNDSATISQRFVSSVGGARIAVYEARGAAPRVEEVAAAPVAEFIEAISSRVHRLVGEAGGNIPYTIVREVAENLIHAGFSEPVVSILDGGSVVRFSDQGPGIAEKDRALMPGYTTATGDMKAYIRGVGSGFPIVRDFLSFSGGNLVIEDNLGGGSVVTIASGPSRSVRRSTSIGLDSAQPHLEVAKEIPVEPSTQNRPRLSNRQTQVLALVLESGVAGPSLVSRELSVGLSTAYRDLALLEERGLIEADGGKRTVTERGLHYLDELTAR